MIDLKNIVYMDVMCRIIEELVQFTEILKSKNILNNDFIFCNWEGENVKINNGKMYHCILLDQKDNTILHKSSKLRVIQFDGEYPYNNGVWLPTGKDWCTFEFSHSLQWIGAFNNLKIFHEAKKLGLL